MHSRRPPGHTGAAVTSTAAGGGVIVTWEDPCGSDQDVYAQRVDGAGGAVITWRDYRDSLAPGADVHASRVFATGLVFRDGFESGDTADWGP